jgi:ankyrin repeat protein
VTVKVGALSRIANRIFPNRAWNLTQEFVYHISMADTPASGDPEDALWKKMERYLKKGANPDGKSSCGEYAIEALCSNSHHAAALKLLEEYPGLKADVTRRKAEITPLMYALRDVQPALVKALCAHGADVNAAVLDASPPLTAVEFMIRHIKGREADALACMKILTEHGLAPEESAKRRIFTDAPVLAQFLPDVQEAVDFATALRDADNLSLRNMLAKGVSIDAGVQWGATPALLRAAACGNPGAIDLLLAHGADVDTKAPVTGATALHHAALGGQREAFLKLLDKGADPAALWTVSPAAQMSVTDAASKSTDPGMQDFVKSVIEARQNHATPDVEVHHAVRRAKTIRLKPRPPQHA